MKCQVTSNTTHEILISKEISYKSYNEVCSGEKKKVNLGHWGNWQGFMVENNTMILSQRRYTYEYLHSIYPSMAYDSEVLSKFFSIYNIEQNWLDCNYTTGHYDEELGGWTGCMGKV